MTIAPAPPTPASQRSQGAHGKDSTSCARQQHATSAPGSFAQLMAALVGPAGSPASGRGQQPSEDRQQGAADASTAATAAMVDGAAVAPNLPSPGQSPIVEGAAARGAKDQGAAVQGSVIQDAAPGAPRALTSTVATGSASISGASTSTAAGEATQALQPLAATPATSAPETGALDTGAPSPAGHTTAGQPGAAATPPSAPADQTPHATVPGAATHVGPTPVGQADAGETVPGATPDQAQPVAAGPASAPTAQAPANVATASVSTVSRQVIPELTRMSSLGEGTHRLTMTLKPEALGEVRVTMTVRDGSIHVRLAGGVDAQHALVPDLTQLQQVLKLGNNLDVRVVVRDLATGLQQAATGDQPSAGQSGQPGANQQGNGQQASGQQGGYQAAGQQLGPSPHTGHGAGDSAHSGHHSRREAGTPSDINAMDGAVDETLRSRSDSVRHTRDAGVDLTM